MERQPLVNGEGYLESLDGCQHDQIHRPVVAKADVPNPFHYSAALGRLSGGMELTFLPESPAGETNQVFS